MAPRTRKKPRLSERSEARSKPEGSEASIAGLTTNILCTIFGRLDHDTLFVAGSTCRAWHACQTSSENLWQTAFQCRGWTRQSTETISTWREAYKQHYQTACYDCFKPCTRRTLSFAPLVLRLCQDCRLAYAEAPLPHQRLIPKTQAKQRWCLRDRDIASLPYAVDANPIDPAFAPMHLYRVCGDVRQTALSKFGSMQALEAERKKRANRR
jgi:hypothetical protein